MIGEARLDLEPLTRKTWDVLVIGAGPAGGLAAQELARRNMDVLLVDRKPFPRWKVCGACLNSQAVTILQQSDLESRLERLQPIPLREFRWGAVHRHGSFPLAGGCVVSRSRLDATLVEAAEEAGTRFVPGVSARVTSNANGLCRVKLRSKQTAQTVSARIVLLASGLGGGTVSARSGRTHNEKERVDESLHKTGTSPDEPQASDPGFPLRTVVARRSRIGAGAVLTRFPEFYSRGVVFMAVNRNGYVGLVQQEDGRLNVAGAFNLNSMRQSEPIGEVVCRILREADFPTWPELAEADWQGTPRLTQHMRRPSAERLFVIGDAASYVEPFTGEGIAWALESGRAVVPLVLQGVENWKGDLADQWSSMHRMRIRRRQTACQVLTGLLRFPTVISGSSLVFQKMPRLANPFLRFFRASMS